MHGTDAMVDEAKAGEGAPVKRGRGRPKGSPNKPKNIPAADRAVNADDNKPAPKADKPKAPKGPTVSKEPLTDEQEHKLTAHHATVYENKLKAKKEADAAFKNACKIAKSEGVSLKQIKEYLLYQTEEGVEKLREDLARRQKVARWAGIPVGATINFLEEIDRTPIDERTFDDGKRAGMRGDKCEVPRHIPGNLISKWTEGWQAGQAVLASKFQPTEDEPAATSERAFNDDLDGNTQGEDAEGDENDETEE